ncbi:MAG: NifB/NifX family molybdenum-iron cluster-binding protein [Spirochaetaceae bacterium]|jgi:ATP-binding protein involved in chromosome partitioning|nr:NifB/NifX family molybdenum-iron cluster-binding protein [Spirochaetaceae bacterium]
MEKWDARIAFPSNDGITVEEHFGHCRQFVICNIKGGQQVSRETLDPPVHAPGVFPAFLAEKGASTIITGGMGARAVELFKENNIDVILGAQGSIDESLKEFLGGELYSKGSVCNHGEEGCE